MLAILFIIKITSIFTLYSLILSNHTSERFLLSQDLQITAISIILGAIGLSHAQFPAQCFVVARLPSHAWLLVNPWTAARQASLCLTISQSLPTFMSSARWLLNASAKQQFGIPLLKYFHLYTQVISLDCPLLNQPALFNREFWWNRFFVSVLPTFIMNNSYEQDNSSISIFIHDIHPSAFPNLTPEQDTFHPRFRKELKLEKNILRCS